MYEKDKFTFECDMIIYKYFEHKRIASLTPQKIQSIKYKLIVFFQSVYWSSSLSQTNTLQPIFSDMFYLLFHTQMQTRKRPVLIRRLYLYKIFKQ